jgi:BirA family biotin operon repressor/biotin-[acetyl-CoA-carboxylase] ligase
MSARGGTAGAADPADSCHEGGMDLLSSQSIEAGLRTAFVGHELVYLPEVGSTNEVARRMGQEGAAEGTVVVADYQSGGRGRLGRGWQAPRGSSLLLSLLFRPPLASTQVQRLTMACGLAVADAVGGQTGLEVGLKWPNDVVMGGQKAGGILTELEMQGNTVAFAVVGIGLNVNLEPRALGEDLLMQATSLSQALGRPVPRLPLLLALLEAAEARYLALCQGHSPHREWAERLVTLGERVTVSGAGPRLDGVAVGVNADGALQLRLDDGQLETVWAGDVSLRPPD